MDLVTEIKCYLKKHPLAADTVVGIRCYWLENYAYCVGCNEVENALIDLIEQGCVEKIKNYDGSIIYCAKKYKK